MAKLPKGSELRAQLAIIRSQKQDGQTDEEIAMELGLPWEDYEKLLSKFYDLESEAIRTRPTEKVYVDYVNDQLANIRDLTKILDTFNTTKQHSAMVGAIRARSEIQDKVIKMGQEFGFIDKRPDTRFVAGVLVHKLSDNELKSSIEEKLGALAALQAEFGEGANILDVPVGDIHQKTPKAKVLAKGSST